MSQSGYEVRLQFEMKALGLPTPEVQYRFAAPRRWRLDFAWLDRGLALEVDGGTWIQGRHVRGKGYEQDVEKLNEAALRGFRTLRVTTGMVKDGRAIEVVRRAFSEPVTP